MSYRTLFFDLDDTLYPNQTGLWHAIRERMTLFMQERLAVPAGEVRALRKRYYQTYGTTLRGLQLHYQVDADDYLTYVHDLPLEQFLAPNPALHAMLLSLPQQRWVFTNADAAHARRVLAILGLADCFQGIIDIKALDYQCKPGEEAYRRALGLAGELQSRGCVLLDDSLNNLDTARQMGFTTVLVGHNGELLPDGQLALNDLLELPAVMPELWDGIRS